MEIASEGPALGEAQPWAQAIEVGPRTLLRPRDLQLGGLPDVPAGWRRPSATSPAIRCSPCRVFDEIADAGVWAAAAVPGSPYAVALEPRGVALAKGTFNSLVQLESIVATARARERGLSLAAGELAA